MPNEWSVTKWGTNSINPINHYVVSLFLVWFWLSWNERAILFPFRYLNLSLTPKPATQSMLIVTSSSPLSRAYTGTYHIRFCVGSQYKQVFAKPKALVWQSQDHELTHIYISKHSQLIFAITIQSKALRGFSDTSVTTWSRLVSWSRLWFAWHF